MDWAATGRMENNNSSEHTKENDSNRACLCKYLSVLHLLTVSIDLLCCSVIFRHHYDCTLSRTINPDIRAQGVLSESEFQSPQIKTESSGDAKLYYSHGRLQDARSRITVVKCIDPSAWTLGAFSTRREGNANIFAWESISTHDPSSRQPAIGAVWSR